MRLVLPVGTLVLSLKSETFLQTYPLFCAKSIESIWIYVWDQLMWLVPAVQILVFVLELDGGLSIYALCCMVGFVVLMRVNLDCPVMPDILNNSI
eukprot:scaffold255027_cov54-Attheya_sp.AAC.2